MTDTHESTETISLTALAVEMEFITPQEAQLAEARCGALRRGGIHLSPGQTLLERRFIQPFQIKMLTKELERRAARSGVLKAPKASVPLRIFGQYELLEVISEKTHSRIFKARDTVLDRTVVLKILPNSLKKNPQWAERFRRETLFQGRMKHPNLVQAYSGQDIENCPVIVMEYVDGTTVGDRIENEGCLPEKQSWLIGREIAKALAYAATLDVIHRDIKPDNIICSRGGAVKLIDMGFSKSLSDKTQLTIEGTTIGTPFYISPEQARGTQDLDVRTDIYSLGCTIYHMLTGVPPFWGDEITEVMLKHIEAKRPDPRSVVPEICAGSAALVMRMMAARPEKRPQTPDEVIEEITALLPSLPKLASESATKQPAKKLSSVMRIPAQVVPPNAAGRNDSLLRLHSADHEGGIWNRVKSWFGY